MNQAFRVVSARTPVSITCKECSKAAKPLLARPGKVLGMPAAAPAYEKHASVVNREGLPQPLQVAHPLRLHPADAIRPTLPTPAGRGTRIAQSSMRHPPPRDLETAMGQQQGQGGQQGSQSQPGQKQQEQQSGQRGNQQQGGQDQQRQQGGGQMGNQDKGSGQPQQESGMGGQQGGSQQGQQGSQQQQQQKDRQ
ncbi:hypothetical protein [Cupriavidus sp. H18C2]|uniref:hypothetical protein n=1 Tax=Cupriavidus sp. H18C2 TaxID=3241602 RepID=UPI003BF8F796